MHIELRGAVECNSVGIDHVRSARAANRNAGGDAGAEGDAREMLRSVEDDAAAGGVDIQVMSKRGTRIRIEIQRALLDEKAEH